jgi:DNA-directed RNA polymerase specialized sigma24 family protein
MLTSTEQTIQTSEVFDRIVALLKSAKRAAGRPEKRERNVEIFIERYCFGTSYRELSSMFQLCPERIRAIVARMERYVILTLKNEGVVL